MTLCTNKLCDFFEAINKQTKTSLSLKKSLYIGWNWTSHCHSSRAVTYFRWAPCGLTRMPANFEICLGGMYVRTWADDFEPRIHAQFSRALSDRNECHECQIQPKRFWIEEETTGVFWFVLAWLLLPVYHTQRSLSDETGKSLEWPLSHLKLNSNECRLSLSSKEHQKTYWHSSEKKETFASRNAEGKYNL